MAGVEGAREGEEGSTSLSAGRANSDQMGTGHREKDEVTPPGCALRHHAAAMRL